MPGLCCVGTVLGLCWQRPTLVRLNLEPAPSAKKSHPPWSKTTSVGGSQCTAALKTSPRRAPPLSLNPSADKLWEALAKCLYVPLPLPHHGDRNPRRPATSCSPLCSGHPEPCFFPPRMDCGPEWILPISSNRTRARLPQYQYEVVAGSIFCEVLHILFFVIPYLPKSGRRQAVIIPFV